MIPIDGEFTVLEAVRLVLVCVIRSPCFPLEGGFRIGSTGADRPTRSAVSMRKRNTAFNQQYNALACLHDLTHVWVEEVLEVLAVLDLVLGHQVVELHQHHRHQIRYLKKSYSGPLVC